MGWEGVPGQELKFQRVGAALIDVLSDQTLVSWPRPCLGYSRPLQTCVSLIGKEGEKSIFPTLSTVEGNDQMQISSLEKNGF